jgi:hypothetical protein
VSKKKEMVKDTINQEVQINDNRNRSNYFEISFLVSNH